MLSPAKESIFSIEDFQDLDALNVPKHIAIIPDGNRRWAKLRGLNPIIGHQWGAEAAIEIISAAKEIGVKYLTLYTFSTENWRRSQEEIDAFMHLYALVLDRETPRMVEEGIRLCTIGDMSSVPQFVCDTIENTKKATEHNDEIHFILALNYGARDELRRAFDRLSEKQKSGEITHISEELISSCLDTAAFPDPELIIRSSGEQRLSNFLLWQASYSEYQAPDILWPDYRPHHLLQAILDYQKRQRRLGA